MASVKFGNVVSDARGKIGGMVYSRNTSGAYIRTKVTPVNPVSEFSSRSRGIFKTISQLWATGLTDVQRAAWRTFASTHPFTNIFGDALILSGVAMFQAVNRRFGELGVTYLLTPTGDYSSDTVVGYDVPLFTETAAVPISVILNILTAGTAPTHGVFYAFMTPPIPEGRVPQKNDFRLINSPTEGTFTAPDFDIVSLVTSRFSDRAFPLGSIVYFRVARLNTDSGCLGAAAVGSVVVTVAP